MDTTARGPQSRAGAAHFSVAVGAVLLAAALAGSGCARSADDTGAGDGVTGLGSAPTPAATAAGGEAGQPPAPANTYPDTPRAYAEALIAAWTGPDLDRLADLSTAQVHDQLIQIPGPPSPDWTFITCDTGHYCSFYNGDGDFLVLLVPAASVGQANAAAQVAYNVVSYPDDDIDYTRELVEAWRNGNLGRMQLLALPEAVDVLKEINPGEVFGYGHVGGGAGLSIVMVSGVGFEFEVHVRTMFLGQPQAVGLVIREV
jgi:hypothetical protein